MNGIAIFDHLSSTSLGISGSIEFHQCSKNDVTQISVNLQGFEPNRKYAAHVHNFGDLSQGCTSCGSHFNPFKQQHGSGKHRHVGDMQNNFETDNKGKMKFTFTDDLISLFGPHDIYGRSVVIHTGIDDLGLGNNAESKKTGNAGGRLACVVIGRAKASPCT